MNLEFKFDERHKWHSRDEVPPVGELLISDGVSTWIVNRRSNKPFHPLKHTMYGDVILGPDSKVRWWRSFEEVKDEIEHPLRWQVPEFNKEINRLDAECRKVGVAQNAYSRERCIDN